MCISITIKYLCKNNPKWVIVLMSLGMDGHLIHCSGHFPIIKKCVLNDGAPSQMSHVLRSSLKYIISPFLILISSLFSRPPPPFFTSTSSATVRSLSGGGGEWGARPRIWWGRSASSVPTGSIYKRCGPPVMAPLWRRPHRRFGDWSSGRSWAACKWHSHTTCCRCLPCPSSSSRASLLL